MLVKSTAIISSLIYLAALCSVSMAQAPTTTITLGPNQVGLVKTAERITTRISFPETVKEIICGDLYDPASGRGSFVVQGSDMDVFLKPIVPRGVSNIFVKTGKNGEFIYSLDLIIVPVSEAHRIVIVTNPRSGLQSARTLSEPAKPSTRNPPLFPTITSEGAENAVAGTIPFDMLIKVSDRSESFDPPAPVLVKTRFDNPSAPKTAGNALVEGEPIKRVAATYPEYAKSVGASGPVTVEVRVDEKGKVKSAKAISGHMYLREAAVIAAYAWKFSPTKTNGVPVEASRQILFNFNRSQPASEGTLNPIPPGPHKKLQNARNP
jgi:TonB family protein